MAVSSNSIILGNMPKNGKDENYKMVAFMGQIPVKVIGTVKIGDFIIPSGLNDGTGIAISPELVTLDLYNKVVGRAWTISDIEKIVLINIHVELAIWTLV